MTTPRAHADLVKLYYSDKEMQCWVWLEITKKWKVDCSPLFKPDLTYYVGKEAPTEPPQSMCELAGVKFPIPEQERLTYGQVHYSPNMDNPEDPIEDFWDGTSVDEKYLEHNLIQLTKEGAIQQALAMRAALNQAVEKAKEKMK